MGRMHLLDWFSGLVQRLPVARQEGRRRNDPMGLCVLCCGGRGRGARRGRRQEEEGEEGGIVLCCGGWEEGEETDGVEEGVGER